jgi:uncharacterized protein YjbI with pentapeptide repeats
MPKNAHFAKLLEGPRRWNEWRKEHPRITPDLSGAELIGANYSRIDFSGVNLSGSDLTKAIFTNADLSNADLSDADLDGAVLGKANLTRADFRDAYLGDAILSRASCSAANFTGANLTNATCQNTILTGANLTAADLCGADFSGANLEGAILENAILVRTVLARSKLTNCLVYGVSAWDVRGRPADQSNLVITPLHEPTIQVDDLEVAQFIYVLLNNQKIRNVIETVGKKAVLILGRFTPERKDILDALKAKLRRSDYLPILFDFDEPGNRDLQETILTLASLSRLIIADISDPKSIPQELAVIVPNLPSVIVQPVLQRGFEPWALYEHIARFPWVLPLKTYDDRQMLMAELDKGLISKAAAKSTFRRTK